MTASSTPGPWKVANDGFEIVMDDGDVEARVGCAFVDNTEDDQARADARLMAAAPEMLAALKLLHKWFEITGSSVNARWERIPPTDRAEIITAAKNAITKAEGRA